MQVLSKPLRQGKGRKNMQLFQHLISIFEDKRELLDLSSFNDPLALEISWTPIVRGGSSFCTHRAKENRSLSGTTIRFQATTGAKLFCAAFVGAGLIGSLGVLTTFLLATQPFHLAAIPVAFFAMLFPVIFGGAGALLYRSLQRHECTFDKFTGQLVRGETIHKLTDVCAIQLIRERIRSSGTGNSSHSSYDSYELNLVRRDGTRLNVTDHGSLSRIRADADLVAGYLNIPIWDVIDYRLPDTAWVR